MNWVGSRFDNAPTPAELLVQHPKGVLALCGLFVAICAMGLTLLVKNPSIDAFTPAGDPVAATRDLADDLFGLEDPLIVILAAAEGETVFTPAYLKDLRDVTETVSTLPEIDGDRVISLATENWIGGDEYSLLVEPIIPSGPLSSGAAELALERHRSDPLNQGLLVSSSEDAFMIIAPLLEAEAAPDAYGQLVDRLGTTTHSGLDVHIAGVAAMNSRLGTLMSDSTRVFIPVASIIVFLTIWWALGRSWIVGGVFLVAVGAAASTLGLMGWFGANYYVVTTALPVVILAISIADSLHLVTAVRSQSRAGWGRQKAVMRGLSKTFGPISLTSLTTVAAFLMISYLSPMPPISEFGLFAAIGVTMAWLLSTTFLPALLMFAGNGAASRTDTPLRLTVRLKTLAQTAHTHSGRVLLALSILLAGLATVASTVSTDYARKNYFAADDPVIAADTLLSSRFVGGSRLDIIISTEAVDGLLEGNAMAAIAELQMSLDEIASVEKSIAITDPIRSMNAALKGGAREVPEDGHAISQYLLIYEASGQPDDFKSFIDYEYRYALVRAYLKQDQFSATKHTVRHVQAVLDQWSHSSGLDAKISGRIALNHSWMSALERGHAGMLAGALAMLFLVAGAWTRSLKSAVYSMLPVCFGVAAVYALMASLDIGIAPATAMCATIAAGLGVDFGVHLVMALRRDDRLDAFAETATACAFSAASMGLGMCVVMLSAMPVLQWFGMLIAAGTAVSFLTAILLLPALHGLSRPQILKGAHP